MQGCSRHLLCDGSCGLRCRYRRRLEHVRQQQVEHRTALVQQWPQAFRHRLLRLVRAARLAPACMTPRSGDSSAPQSMAAARMQTHHRGGAVCSTAPSHTCMAHMHPPSHSHTGYAATPTQQLTACCNRQAARRPCSAGEWRMAGAWQAHGRMPSVLRRRRSVPVDWWTVRYQYDAQTPSYGFGPEGQRSIAGSKSRPAWSHIARSTPSGFEMRSSDSTTTGFLLHGSP